MPTDAERRVNDMTIRCDSCHSTTTLRNGARKGICSNCAAEIGVEFKVLTPSVLIVSDKEEKERRERIATAAMQGMLSNSAMYAGLNTAAKGNCEKLFAMVAVSAVLQADYVITEIDRQL